jgi:thiamine kinase-like enzyme
MELFQADNLSLHQPEFTNVDDTQLRNEVVAALNESYAFSRDSATLQLRRVVGANVVSQNFVVQAGAARYFLKRRSDRDLDNLIREATLAIKLAEMGLRVPRVIPTEEGSSVHIGPQSCLVMYSFEGGRYFTGRGRELDSAAEAFGTLTHGASVLFGEVDRNREAEGERFLEELGPLLDDAVDNLQQSAVAQLLSEHGNTVLDHLNEVRTRRAEIESQTLPMHLDYHPLNLLMKDREVSCILDFEHLQSYPVVAGLGFAGYKLVRQAMVDEVTRAEEFSKPTLLYRWLEGWRKSFPDVSFSPTELGFGARYRVLFLIHFILKAWLERNDSRFTGDLEKQLRSLYEIEAIVSAY